MLSFIFPSGAHYRLCENLFLSRQVFGWAREGGAKASSRNIFHC